MQDNPSDSFEAFYKTSNHMGAAEVKSGDHQTYYKHIYYKKVRISPKSMQVCQVLKCCSLDHSRTNQLTRASLTPGASRKRKQQETKKLDVSCNV